MSDIVASLDALTTEIKGIKHILSSLWHSKYFNGETDQVSPEFYADEYISTAECAKRLNVSEQTIRNWILAGKSKNPKSCNQWIQGIHYVLIPTGPRRTLVRIAWNNLIAQFTKGPEANLRTFDPAAPMYQNKSREHWSNVPIPKQNKENDEQI